MLAAFELLLIGKVMITILKFLVVDRPSYTGKMPAYASALAPYCARVFGPPSTESTVDPDKMFDVSGCVSCLMLFQVKVVTSNTLSAISLFRGGSHSATSGSHFEEQKKKT